MESCRLPLIVENTDMSGMFIKEGCPFQRCRIEVSDCDQLLKAGNTFPDVWHENTFLEKLWS